MIRTKAAEEEDPEGPHNLQVRYIVRRKCTLEGLWRILNAPPNLPEITDTLLANEGGRYALLWRHQVKVSTLTREQTFFLQAQHRKYEQRLCHAERVHQHAGPAILAAGLEGCGSEMGVDLRVVRSTLGGPAHTLRIFQTLIHSYIFSGMVHLGD